MLPEVTRMQEPRQFSSERSEVIRVTRDIDIRSDLSRVFSLALLFIRHSPHSMVSFQEALIFSGLARSECALAFDELVRLGVLVRNHRATFTRFQLTRTGYKVGTRFRRSHARFPNQAHSTRRKM